VHLAVIVAVAAMHVTALFFVTAHHVLTFVMLALRHAAITGRLLGLATAIGLALGRLFLGFLPLWFPARSLVPIAAFFGALAFFSHHFILE
jgi:hypothetical protein